ncbi:hypothetical protein ETD86_40325 [Nonomuraea turkmeniaca]|uniref:Uncharacterized protein n=1 Tax=Nonomuraea turkmeniaca TaxID=103838 RepID=A0A5S4FM51_9ACTN|nr:hypothetical protein [Nonomuraea turkmeniaca]TMR10227.1 hypothetical protein ETD86_40325 [Nonomuraea turkmeniaca]
MRTRLPAALLLLLSWFLPATAHARPAQVTPVQVVAAWRAQEQPGLGQEPYRHTTMQARHGLLGLAGAAGPAVLPSSLPYPAPAWAAVVAPSGTDIPAGRRPLTAKARGPPSTGF